MPLDMMEELASYAHTAHVSYNGMQATSDRMEELG
jgi:hypothetical protein